MKKQYNHLGVVLGRTMMATIFILSGVSKIGAMEATQSYMQAMGVPGVLLIPTILFEIIFGLLVVTGYRLPIVSSVLSIFCLMTAAIFHHNFQDQIQMIMFLKNVSMAGGFLVLACISYEKDHI